MSSATAWRQAAADLACRWRRGARSFDRFALIAMYAFARAWHGCARVEHDPVPPEGPAILVANHGSHADPAFLMAACTRPLHLWQARECYEVPVLRRLFARVGCIPLARGTADVGAIRAALDCLSSGQVVAVFPEGEVSPTWRGPMRPAKRGAALLALRSGAPVIPAWIEGGPRSRNLIAAWLLPSREVRVVFGPPIDLSAYRGRPLTRTLVDEATAVVASRIAALRPAPRDASSAHDNGHPHLATEP
jgi:1-acyl-sn-glycerol-3-phosphate acyltransferase